jgi:hypothetical protein
VPRWPLSAFFFLAGGSVRPTALRSSQLLSQPIIPPHGLATLPDHMREDAFSLLAAITSVVR